MSKEKAYAYIRWSSKKQDGNDSKRRQEKFANQFAKRPDQNLDLTFIYDKGKSAYHSDHAEQGNLGQFIEKAKAGKFPDGTKLLIEKLDRLSRENLFKDRVKELLDEGIHICITTTGEVLTKDSWSFFDEITSAFGRHLAHKESDDKSDRLKESWEAKVEAARNGGPKLSSMSPMWLDPIKNDQGQVIDYDTKDDVVEAIITMFEMKLNGKGSYTIERELNQMDIYHPPKSKRNKNGAWRKSTIDRYLKDKRLLGKYQPCKVVYEYSDRLEKKVRRRKPVGPPIKDYYPNIFEEKFGNTDKFYRVEKLIKKNSNKKGNGGGRKTVSNLFQSIVWCGHCGDKMQFEGKGKWEYLRCDTNRRGLGCEESSSIRYDGGFEPTLLKLCTDLDPSNILPNNEQQQSQLAVLQNKLDAVTPELDHLKSEEQNLRNIIKATDNVETQLKYDEDLQDVLSQIDEKQKAQANLEAEKERLESSKIKTKQRLENIRELIQYMGELEGKKLIDLRRKLRQRIQQIIDRITITQSNSIRIEVLFTTDRKIELNIGDDWVDGSDSDYDKEKQREANRKVGRAIGQISESRTEK